MPALSNPIRLQAEEYILAEIARVGADELDHPAIAKLFIARGASRATVYRWIKEVVASVPKPTVDAAAPSTPQRVPMISPTAPQTALMAAAEKQAAILADLPTSADIQALELPGQSSMAIMKQIQNLVVTCNHVLKAAQTDGKVRNPRMTLQAVDALRKLMETMAKVSESVNNVAKVERFMQEVIATMRMESPETARRLVDRLTLVFDRWEGINAPA